MDKTSRYFDRWASTGKAEEMEKGHGNNVNKFLDKIDFEKEFTFLDIGCGNGWVVRRMAKIDTCKKAIGIDKSQNMIKNAKSKCISKKEVARILNISESTVSRWAKLGIIPKPFQLGPNKTNWDADEIYECIEQKKKVRGFLGHKPERVLNVIKTQ